MEQSGSGRVFYGIRKLPYSQDPANTSYPIKDFSRHSQTLNAPILILSQNLRLGVPRSLLRSGFPTNFAESSDHSQPNKEIRSYEAPPSRSSDT